MNPAEYQAMYRVEDTLWWYQGMRRIAAVLIGDRLAPGSRILDAGCGTGGNLAWIDGDTSRLGKPRTGFGVDLSEEAMGFCQARNLERVAQASVCDLPFASESFDGVLSFDVIYHLGVTSDLAALREAARVLRPGGWALIRVPAFDALLSAHDAAVHTRERYRLASLKERVSAAGLVVERATYANTLLFPIAAISRMIRRPSHGPGEPSSDVRPASGTAQAIGSLALRLEALALERASLPFGLSAIVLATRPREVPR